MVKNEIETVLKLAETLNQRVIGQRHALEMIARRIQTSRAKLDNPNKPIGVFMLCGPSGVGKTETALTLAEALYGGEQNVITINMSEFQEAHTVSTLKGSPPGYVGYGEGGVLTEAVRRRPYSVVLLDEVEKAHSDVHELFFQVFDKGWMEDGEGRHIDFKNTIILLTSNVGTDLIMSMCKDPELMPEPEGIAKALREPLLKKFPAALLGRLVVIPYYPLSDEMLANIVRLQLGRIAKRVAEHHKIPFTYDDDAVKLIVSRCTEVESGGRMIDAILTNTVLPAISREFLTRTMAGAALNGVRLAVADGDFAYQFDLDSAVTEARDAQLDTSWSSADQIATSASTRRCRSRSGCQQQRPAGRRASDIYRRILEVAPDHPDALHYSGVLAHQQGRSDEAIALIERSLELAPDQADWLQQPRHRPPARWTRLDEAIAACQRAIALDPEHANAHNNLGVLLQGAGPAGRGGGGVSRGHSSSNPDHADAYHQPGHPAGRHRSGSREAVVCYCKVITLEPEAPGGAAAAGAGALHARRGRQGGGDLRGVAAGGAGQPDRPAHAGRLLGPRRAGARVRRVSSRRSSTASPTASTPSSRSCAYRAPALVAGDAGRARASSRRSASTCSMPAAAPGLCGPLRRAVCARGWSGVDLSAGMLTQARERHVYDELVKGELTAYLRASPGAFDVIVSADTLVYFGPLDEVVAAAAAALRPGGRLIFTVEESCDGDAQAGFSHQPARPLQPRARLRRARAGERGTAAARSRARSCGSKPALRSPGWWCARRSRPDAGAMQTHA